MSAQYRQRYWHNVCWVSSLEITSVQGSALDLFKEATQGSLTQWQMALVACFAPDRVNEMDGVSTVPCSVALFWSSAQLMTCQMCCMALLLGVLSWGASVTNEIEKHSAEILSCAMLSCVVWIGAEQEHPATLCCLAWTH